MAAPLSLPPVDLSGPPLLLGPGGDVRLLDGRKDDPAGLVVQLASVTADRPVGVRLCHQRLVESATAAGASLLHLDPAAGWSHEVRTAAEAGLVVVFAGAPELTVRAAVELLEHGGRPGRVVVELPVREAGDGIDDDLIRRTEGAGVAVGASFEDSSDAPEESIGWQIGMVTHLLQLGVRTFRGVPAERFTRVRTVVDELRSARSGLAGRSVEAPS